MAKKVKVARYESLREFADAAVAGYESLCADIGAKPAPNGHKSRHRNDGGKGCFPSSNVTDRDGWYGCTRSIYEARDLCVDGWTEGAGAIEANLDKIMPRIREYMDTVPESIPQVYGDVWDLQEYLNGNPEYAWEAIPTEEMRAGNVITVLLNTTASYNVSAETLAYRGSLVLAVMEVLQLLGFEMDVWVETTNDTHRGTMVTLVRAKAAGDLIDMQSYSFVTEPGFFRRLMFGIWEGWSPEDRQAASIPDGGYGQCGEIHSMKLLGATIAFHIGGYDGWPRDYRDGMDADKLAEISEKWVRETVENLESQAMVGQAVG